jgi:GT2 family glycosyltransferase
MTARVATVIIHYGAPELCVECLRSIDLSASVRTLLVLVDNNPSPTPALVAEVERLHGRYLHFSENLGFAAGCNAGVRDGLSLGNVDTIALLNSDVRLGRDCLRVLHEQLATRADLGVVGPGLLRTDRENCWWNRGSRIHWPQARPSSICHNKPRGTDEPDLVDVDYVCGAVMAFRPELLSRVGELPEHYFLYFEDADYCRRVRAAGLRVAVCPPALAWHHGGAASRGCEAEVAYYQVRNRLVFSRTWNPYPYRGVVSRVVFALGVGWRAVRRYAAGDARASRACLRGLFDYARGRTGTHQQHPGMLGLRLNR